jgi:putative flavoprotein involved in K+ transport
MSQRAIMRSPSTRAVDVVVVGAGHSGLAMSRCLAALSVDHVVLERGEIANSWRTERWDSLRLLTPNWQCRLPGQAYQGDDPDGFMSMPEVIRFIADYARMTGAPVRTGVDVTAVETTASGYRVVTNDGTWFCRAVVLASGGHAVPLVPGVAAALPQGITSLTPREYRNPDQLDDRPVLIVGASATGLQLADEIRRSGRPVTLAVGEHIRMPRLYRGRDIQFWLDAIGVLDERFDEVDDLVRARRVPSPQLIGTRERVTLDLNSLADRGVEIVGRLVGIRDRKAQFSGSLRNHCAMADLKLGRLLERIDAWVARGGLDATIASPTRFEPTRVPDRPRLGVDLNAERIGTVIWATGFRPDYRWLRAPVLDRKGALRHDGGIVADAPGLYAMGLNFMRRRKSSFIHGATDDALELSAHLHGYLRSTRSARAWLATG